MPAKQSAQCTSLPLFPLFPSPKPLTQLCSTGLPDDEAYGSSDESELDDEDDEDSNAEDWYKNDYPDEEESDRSDADDGSDCFHEHSSADDVMHERRQWDLGGLEDDSYKTL